MELHEAQEIMRGYMAPRSHAINVFAQTGKLHTTYGLNEGSNVGDMLSEAKQELIEAIANEIAEQTNMRELLEVMVFVDTYFEN